MNSPALASLLCALASSACGAVPLGTEAGRRVGRIAVVWLVLALGTIVVLSALVVWHLLRRGRLIRSSLGPPRMVQLPVFEPQAHPESDEIAQQSAAGPEPEPEPPSR